MGTVQGLSERCTHHLAISVRGTLFNEQAGEVGTPTCSGRGHIVREPFSLALALKQGLDSQDSAKFMLASMICSYSKAQLPLGT